MRIEILKDNICSDKPVAIVYNNKNMRIFTVIETRISFLTVPDVNYLIPLEIGYSDCIIEKTDNSKENLFRKVEFACNYFQSKYMVQASQIINDLNDL